MPGVWRSMRLNEPGESVVVVPSVTIDRVAPKAGAINQAMEERYLFLLLLLRQPRLRMVYVTSGPVDPTIVEYYLALLPGVIPSHARARLSMVAVGDTTPRPLTAKILERPRLLEDLRALIPDRGRSHLVPYTTTTLERDLALELGIPMYGADPRHFPLGTKTGCRRTFEEAGVEYPVGYEDLRSKDDIVAALASLRGRRAGVTTAMVKLNEGVAGAGNAVVDLAGLPAPGAADEARALLERIETMELEGTDRHARDLLREVRRAGRHRRGADHRVGGAEPQRPAPGDACRRGRRCSPPTTRCSAARPGSPTSAARSPRRRDYARMITGQAELVGARLAELGVLGRFAIDFVVVRDGDGWRSYAIEINLRKGGTTHPFLTMQFLTNGRYDPELALFATPAGREKHLMATDHLEDPSLCGLRVDDLFDLLARTGLHFDPVTQRGVVLHMISSVTEVGRVGLTAVGDTAADAAAEYARAERIVLAEARAAGAPRPLVT